MPIYEYACNHCGHMFDVLQKLSDNPLTDCPECGESQLKKLLSAPNFRLKGSGWYETDFKKDKQRNLAGDAGKPAEKPSDKDSEKPSGKGSDKNQGKDKDQGKKDATPDSGKGKAAGAGSKSASSGKD